jgi:hypothetical protein
MQCSFARRASGVNGAGEVGEGAQGGEAQPFSERLYPREAVSPQGRMDRERQRVEKALQGCTFSVSGSGSSHWLDHQTHASLCVRRLPQTAGR